MHCSRVTRGQVRSNDNANAGIALREGEMYKLYIHQHPRNHHQAQAEAHHKQFGLSHHHHRPAAPGCCNTSRVFSLDMDKHQPHHVLQALKQMPKG